MDLRRLSALVLGAAGCCHPSPPVAPRPALPTVVRVSPDLPPTKPITPALDAKNLPKFPPTTPTAPTGEFRALTETECLKLAAANSGLANALDEENRVTPAGGCDTPSDQLRRTLRYHTALGFRNQTASDALERFFQLSNAEARTDLLRQVFPITDAMLDKARKAKAAGVRFPFEPAELEEQRSLLVSQLEQAEYGSRMLNLDLKRRIGLPNEAERLWPSGEFVIDAEPVDASLAVNAALADRPELRGLRALRDGLSVDTLPDVRDLLRAGSPLLGGTSSERPMPRLLERIMLRKAGPTPETLAEVEVRRKQLTDLIADQERLVADEARAAALAVNAQRVRATRARDRLLACEEKLADAVKKREANQPGAEFLEPQVRVECLKARAEVVAEVAAWHQARIRLLAAQGWLAWEAAK